MKAILKDLWTRFNITSNTTQKLISILFALVFWLFVMDIENPEINRTFRGVDVQVIGIEQLQKSDLVLMDDARLSIDVKVTGRRKAVLAMTSSDIKLSLDLYRAQAGVATFPILAKILDDSVVVQELSQTEVTWTIDQWVDVTVPIQVDVEGSFEEPYYLDVLGLSADAAIVSGPSSYVDRVVKVSGVLSLEDPLATPNYTVTLIPLDASGKAVEGVTLSIDQVGVTLQVGTKKEVPLVAQLMGDLADNLRLDEMTLSQETITIMGDPSVLDEIDAVTIEPIPMAERSQTETLAVVLVLPEGVTAEFDGPITMTFAISDLKEETYTLLPNQVRWLNLEEGLKVQLANEEGLDILVKGTQEEIDGLSSDTVFARFDLADLEPGTYDLTYRIELFDGLLWVMDPEAPPTAKVIISRRADGE